MPMTLGSPLDDAEAAYRRERIIAAYRPRTPRPHRFGHRIHRLFFRDIWPNPTSSGSART
jgi:fido (protein-threonine AMPylation protein)